MTVYDFGSYSASSVPRRSSRILQVILDLASYLPTVVPVSEGLNLLVRGYLHWTPGVSVDHRWRDRGTGGVTNFLTLYTQQGGPPSERLIHAHLHWTPGVSVDHRWGDRGTEGVTNFLTLTMTGEPGGPTTTRRSRGTDSLSRPPSCDRAAC